MKQIGANTLDQLTATHPEYPMRQVDPVPKRQELGQTWLELDF